MYGIYTYTLYTSYIVFIIYYVYYISCIYILYILYYVYIYTIVGLYSQLGMGLVHYCISAIIGSHHDPNWKRGPHFQDGLLLIFTAYFQG